MAVECFGGKQVTKNWDPLQKTTVMRESDQTKSAYMLFYEREVCLFVFLFHQIN